MVTRDTGKGWEEFLQLLLNPQGFPGFFFAESQPDDQLRGWQQVGAETLAPGSAKRVARLRSAPGALLNCGRSCWVIK